MADYTAGNGVTRVDTDWQGGTDYSTNPGTVGAMGSEYDSTGTVGYIPQIWAGKLIERWYDASVIAAITSTDYEGMIKSYGDTVNIRTEPAIAISDYKIGAPLSYEVPGEAMVELQIDQAKSWAVAIDDVDKHQSDLNLMSTFADSASEQLKVVVDTAVLAAMVGDADADNKGQTAGRISGNLDLGAGDADANIEDLTEATAIEFILRMGQALDEQNAPETGRWLVIPAAMSSLLKESVIAEANTMGDGSSVLRNGKLGTIDRFTVYVSNNLPTVTPTAETGTYIFAGVPSACAFASQITKNETLPNPDSFGQLMRGLQVYGYETVKPEGLVEGCVKLAHS